MKIAIFGSSGFIGSALVNKYLDVGHEVLCVSRNKPDLLSSHITYFKMEFDSYCKSELSQALSGIDCLVYLISSSTPNTSNNDPVQDVQQNLITFIDVLSIAVDSGIGRIIFASSGGAIYSNTIKPPYFEDSPIEPLTSYGIIKIACEQYLEVFRKLHSISYASLRISNPYGPGQNPKLGFGVIPTFVKSLYMGKEINIYGDGSAIRDYLFIDDLTQAFLDLTLLKSSGIYNVGSGVPVTLIQLINTLERITNRKFKVKFHAARDTDCSSVYLDSSKLSSEVGWFPKTSLENGLKKYIDWFEENHKT